MMQHISKHVTRTSSNQDGVVLLLCLVFLTAMMLVGLSASADTILQNRLSANLRASEQARQAAHSALAWAETWLLALDLPSPQACLDTCNPNYFQITGSLPAHPEYQPLSWWREKGFQTGSQPQDIDSQLAPGYFNGDQSLWIIEPVHQLAATFDGTTGTRGWYRVLSRGSAGKESVVSVMESTVVITWPTSEQAAITGMGTGAWCSANPDLCGRVSWRELR